MNFKKPICIYVLAFLFRIGVNAQPFLYSETEFAIPGQEASEVVSVHAFDGGNLLCATTAPSSAWNNTLTIIKVDSAANIQWTRKFSINCTIQQVIECTDSTYLLAVEDQNNGTSYQLIKLATNGTVVYNKRIRNLGYATLGPPLMLERNSGNVILAATVVDTINYHWHYQVLETDHDGNVVMSHVYHDDSLVREVTAIDTFSNGDLFLTGTWQVNYNSEISALIDRIDSAGNLVWSKKIAAASTGLHPYCVEKVAGDNFLMSGMYLHLGPFGYDAGMTLLKIDGNGNVVWCNKYLGYPVQIGEMITISPNDLCVIGGDMGGQTNLLHLDSTGNILSSKGYPRRYFSGVDTLPGGNLIFTGFNYPAKNIVIETMSPQGESCVDSVSVYTKAPFSTYSVSDSGVVSTNTIVYNESHLIMPPAITRSVVCSTVDVEETLPLAIDIHCSWEHSFLNVHSSESIYRIIVFDAAGKMVHQQQTNDSEAQIGLSCLTPGIYIVQVETLSGNGSQKTMKAE
jgi:hypothetical protein